MPCPTCKRPVEWSPANKWRPFCSERCKLIDLGAWAAEKHVVPGEPLEGNDDESSDQAHSDESEHIARRGG